MGLIVPLEGLNMHDDLLNMSELADFMTRRTV